MGQQKSLKEDGRETESIDMKSSVIESRVVDCGMRRRPDSECHLSA